MQSPTYRAMGDHTECFQVDFDPAAIAYEDLLQLFWTSHDPTSESWKTQYASLVLAGDEAQLAAARDSAARLGSTLGRRIATRIETLDRFWLAEDYHQKYYLRNDPGLMSEFHSAYPDESDFVNSTAAARVNGYLYGAGSCAQLVSELEGLGVSERGAGRLRSACSRR